MHNIHKSILSFILLLITSCASQEKIDNLEDYKTIYTESPLIELDNTIKNHSITIPQSTKNNQWLNSNLVLEDIPENILVTSSLNTTQQYRLFKSPAKISNLLRTPVVYKDTLYVLDYSSNLIAYNLKDLSKPKWIKPLDDNANFLLGGGISVNDNFIIVTHGSNVISAIALDGTEIWKQQLSNISRSTPNIHNNKIFISTIDNRLYCLSLNTGSIMWFYQGAIENLHTLQSPSPLIYNDLVIHAFSLNEVVAINKDNGQLIWNSDLSNYQISSTNINDIDLTPVINNNSLYVSSTAGDISSINLDNGFVEWTINKAGSNIAMWSSANHIYTITKDGYLAAIYKITGTVQWIIKLENMLPEKERQNVTFTGPIMINGLLYVVSSNGHLLKISVSKRNLVKIISIPKNQFSFPIAIKDKLYLLSKDGSLTLVN